MMIGQDKDGSFVFAEEPLQWDAPSIPAYSAKPPTDDDAGGTPRHERRQEELEYRWQDIMVDIYKLPDGHEAKAICLELNRIWNECSARHKELDQRDPEAAQRYLDEIYRRLREDPDWRARLDGHAKAKVGAVS